MYLRLTVLIALACSGPAAYAAPITRFTVVDSSPSSWVARGFQDYTVSPEIGWTFFPFRNSDNGVGFEITTSSSANPDRWFLNFAAPFNTEIVPGLYNDFQRYPHQSADRPGLEFGSTGRLDSVASGFFEVFEAAYGTTGEVLSFSADFTHYGEADLNNFAIAEIRYNATVPELSSHLAILGVTGFGLVGFSGRRHRRAHRANLRFHVR